MSTFAWRLITDELFATPVPNKIGEDGENPQSSGGLPIPNKPPAISTLTRKYDLNENQILQLKGVFLHYDSDRDGYLTIDQLSEALLSIGFNNRNKFLVKFLPNASQAKIQGKFISAQESKLKFNTDFKTFITVIGKEIASLRNLESELTVLFNFVDINNTGYISKRELKFLLVDVMSSTRLNSTEFTKFMKSSKNSFDSNDNISISELKKQLILSYC
jgi:Ca2+-binding EF-hand superfamily protein